jgi:hypothetical protein
MTYTHAHAHDLVVLLSNLILSLSSRCTPSANEIITNTLYNTGEANQNKDSENDENEGSETRTTRGTRRSVSMKGFAP